MLFTCHLHINDFYDIARKHISIEFTKLQPTASQNMNGEKWIYDQSIHHRHLKCVHIAHMNIKCQRRWWWPIKIFYLFKSQFFYILSLKCEQCHCVYRFLIKNVHFMVIWMRRDTFMTATRYDKNYNQTYWKLQFMVCGLRRVQSGN